MTTPPAFAKIIKLYLLKLAEIYLKRVIIFAALCGGRVRSASDRTAIVALCANRVKPLNGFQEKFNIVERLRSGRIVAGV